MLYADTSVIVRAYLPDEPDHAEARRLVLSGFEQVFTSELSRIEFASAINRAVKARRIARAAEFLRTFDKDCGPDSPVSLLPFDRERTLADAYALASNHGLKSLDALQLAVALGALHRMVGQATRFRFATRDEDLAAAARAEGLRVV